VLLLVAVPGFATRAAERKANERTLWDRQNLATAAINMVEERPLFGVGWNRFPEIGPNYFWQGDIPLTAGGGGTIIHNAVLANAAELGLIGTTLWLLAYVLGIGGAIVGRAPPAVDAWRIGLIAVAVCWLVMANFTANLNPFQNLALWLWAGVVAAARQPVR
jgi:putative inorganic carbon (HCO3(-)) transporter